jgi:hypothetical protein
VLGHDHGGVWIVSAPGDVNVMPAGVIAWLVGHLYGGQTRAAVPPCGGADTRFPAPSCWPCERLVRRPNRAATRARRKARVEGGMKAF